MTTPGDHLRSGHDRRSLSGALVSCSREQGIAFITVALLLCWGAAWALSHTSPTPRYWFCFPIMLAAARFGRRGALPTALTAGALGSLIPSNSPQTHSEIVTAGLSRTVFFVVMGHVLAVLFAGALSNARRERDTLRAAKSLAIALHRDEFIVWYQPMVELDSGAVIGAEALVRWNHPTRGVVPPREFIETAEDSGIIVALGAHVLDTACRQLALWQTTVLDGVDAFKLAVNVSAYQLSTPDLVRQIERLLDETGIPPAWLNLEITETAAIVDLESTARKVAQLRALGIRIAIDDFGTGHTTLRHLQHLDVDIVKIDRSFVDTVAEDGRDGIAAAVIALAQTLGMHSVAEGVETPRQAARLRELGADYAQGFLYGRPQPASSLTDLLVGQRELMAREQPAGADPVTLPEPFSPS